MNEIEINEVLDAVNDINQVIYETNGEFNCNAEEEVQITTNGTEVIITYLGQTIWFSDDDERIYHEDTDQYENMLTYLKRKCIKLIDKLTPLKNEFKNQL